MKTDGADFGGLHTSEPGAFLLERIVYHDPV